MSETFGEEVKRRRRALGLSKDALMKLTGLSRGAIVNLEDGGMKPRRTTKDIVHGVLLDLEIRGASGGAPSAESVSRRVGEIRFSQQLSQREVAERATLNGFPMHQTQISKIESGDRELSLEDLRGLSSALGVSMYELLGKSIGISLPEGHVAVAVNDLMTVLTGPIGAGQAFVAAADRLHAACLVEAEIVEEGDQ